MTAVDPSFAAFPRPGRGLERRRAIDVEGLIRERYRTGGGQRTDGTGVLEPALARRHSGAAVDRKSVIRAGALRDYEGSKTEK